MTPEERLDRVEANLDRMAMLLLELTAAGLATERRLDQLAENFARHTHEDEV